MSKDTFLCPICGKEDKYGYELVNDRICSDCEEIAEPFLSELDGGDEYDSATEMTIEVIARYVQSKTEENDAFLSEIPKLPQWNEKVEKPPCCTICGEKFKLLNMSMRILDTYICLECFNKAQRYETHKKCSHGTDDIKFHDLEQFRTEVEALNASTSQMSCAVCGSGFKDDHDYLWLADDSTICRNCANKVRSEYPFVTVKERR